MFYLVCLRYYYWGTSNNITRVESKKLMQEERIYIQVRGMDAVVIMREGVDEKNDENMCVSNRHAWFLQ